MRRRAAIATIAAGASALLSAVLLPLLVPTPAAAAGDPGSGFSSFNLQANAPVEQVRFNDGDKCSGTPAGTGGCEGVVPETVATLRNGPIGYALSSVAWPGVLAGNLGSIILVANGPSQAQALNDPVRAEARTGTGPSSVTNSQVPGATMVATAKDTLVQSSADIAQSTNSQVGTARNTTSRSKVEVTGPMSATAEAFSHSGDLSLAGGVVTIGSVTSTAKGTTDGVKASATGSTLVSDVKIAGVPVTIDQHGLTVHGSNAPLNSLASAAVNQAISHAGMSIAISQPSGKPVGGNIVYTAGSLVFAWKTPGGTATAILGGASVELDAVQGGAFVPPQVGGVPFTPGVPPAVSGGAAPLPGTPGSGPVPQVGSPSLSVPAAASPAAGGAVTPVLAASGLPLPTGPSPAYLVVGLLGVGLLAAGLRQLPDRVLEARATACLLGETP